MSREPELLPPTWLFFSRHRFNHVETKYIEINEKKIGQNYSNTSANKMFLDQKHDPKTVRSFCVKYS